MIKQPELGKKIADLRKAKGWTQEELMEKCNISVRTIQRIETGEVTPRSYTIKTILSALDYDYKNVIADPELSSDPLSADTTLDKGNDVLKRLNIAWIFGAIHFLFMFLYVPAEYYRIEGDMLFTAPFYIALNIIVLVSYIYYQMGFIVVAQLFDNYLLKITAILLIMSFVLLSIFNIVTVFVWVDRIPVLFGSAVLLGALGIIYGIALRRIGRTLGRVSKFAAGFEILSGCFFLTVVLAFIGDFIHVAAEICGIVTLYKAIEIVKGKVPDHSLA